MLNGWLTTLHSPPLMSLFSVRLRRCGKQFSTIAFSQSSFTWLVVSTVIAEASKQRTVEKMSNSVGRAIVLNDTIIGSVAS